MNTTELLLIGIEILFLVCIWQLYGIVKENIQDYKKRNDYRFKKKN